MRHEYQRTWSPARLLSCGPNCGARIPGSTVSAAPPMISSAPPICRRANRTRRNTKLATIVSGIRHWLMSGWYWPGVCTAPMAAKNVPKASSTPMIT